MLELGTSGQFWLGWCPGPEPTGGYLQGTPKQSPVGSSSTLSSMQQRQPRGMGTAHGSLGGSITNPSPQELSSHLSAIGPMGSGVAGTPQLTARPLGSMAKTSIGGGGSSGARTTSLLPSSYAICSQVSEARVCGSIESEPHHRITHFACIPLNRPFVCIPLHSPFVCIPLHHPLRMVTRCSQAARGQLHTCPSSPRVTWWA